MTSFKYTPADELLLGVHKRILRELEERFGALFDAHINRPDFQLRTPAQRAAWALERIHDADMRGAVLQMMYLWASGHEGELSALLRGVHDRRLAPPSNTFDASGMEIIDKRDRLLSAPAVGALPAVIDVKGEES